MTRRNGLLGILGGILRPRRGSVSTAPPVPRAPTESRSGRAATVEVPPPSAPALRMAYAPDRDGDPDAGEIVWTWVPYAENDGRGKDRPVLVIARQSDDRVYAVRLTSKAHDGDRDFLAIGTGEWDAQGRPSWVDIDQLYSVHRDGMRREASALDPERFARVAGALHRRYGWVDGS
ncbi:type II toxin-antitoxin system PemK/MazF family toxin [Microbacterium sp. QXD-8]|uniref:Type II toxin-antitoxin system PemK/MazF family toxin n=1 Tax=Microbacterium psychrotolerans TaxID=3068321 RepID=A0ABU0Z185_9MICO|nr:type II toxin-antitoxin system PemK/MazF family toxin [Microbacterium sp. QXD-8]MDQ7877785.1 type II toxin-antitoxin system PemK/MazF family toxin [Microbacterium sp. QXD-8]